MCLYPKLIKNRKYTITKKNGGKIPPVHDERVLMVPIGCGKCMECKKQKARQWSIRLQEEIRNNKEGKFVTMTFNEESLSKLKEEIKGLEGYELDNEVATLAMRRFLERWRKRNGVSVKHWMITELGQKNTERIHLHGIIFTNKGNEIAEIWKYGNVWVGEYVNDKTINYIVKYVNKADEKHKEYNSKILTSKGIGKGYIERNDSKMNKYKKNETKESYTTRQGIDLNLPIYYRNKIYEEEEREQLWLEKLDKQERYVLGKKIKVRNEKEEEYYYKALEEARKKNKRLGYGDDSINWERKRYENERRRLNNKNK